MAFNFLYEEEMDREDLVRTVRCPVCKAAPGRRCKYPVNSQQLAAHTGRYNAAVKAGLVPAMVGSHGA